MGIYFRSILAGVVGAVVACGISIAVMTASMLVRMNLEIAATGSGGLGAVSSGFVEAGLEFALPAGFAIGFYWMFRRLRKRKAQA